MSHLNLPAHQARQQQVAGGAEFLGLLGEEFALAEGIGGDLAEAAHQVVGREGDLEVGDGSPWSGLLGWSLSARS